MGSSQIRIRLIVLMAGLSAVGTAFAAETGPATASSEAPGGTARRMVILIPQTDAEAPSWLGLLARYPHFRMVVALSPKFRQLANNPALKEQVLSWQKMGRLEIALQVPNPPILPLLIQTDSARRSNRHRSMN